MGTYKIGELPQHSAIRFFCYRKSLKIHIENEKGSFLWCFFFLFFFFGFVYLFGTFLGGNKDNRFYFVFKKFK